MGLDAMIIVSWTLSFNPTFSLFSFTFLKRLFRGSSLSAISVVSSAYLRLLIFLLEISWRILEWVYIPWSSGSSLPKDWTWISHIAGRFFYHLSHQLVNCISVGGKFSVFENCILSYPAECCGSKSLCMFLLKTTTTNPHCFSNENHGGLMAYLRNL